MTMRATAVGDPCPLPVTAMLEQCTDKQLLPPTRSSSTTVVFPTVNWLRCTVEQQQAAPNPGNAEGWAAIRASGMLCGTDAAQNAKGVRHRTCHAALGGHAWRRTTCAYMMAALHLDLQVRWAGYVPPAGRPSDVLSHAKVCVSWQWPALPAAARGEKHGPAIEDAEVAAAEEDRPGGHGWVYMGSHNFSAAAWGQPRLHRQVNHSACSKATISLQACGVDADALLLL